MDRWAGTDCFRQRAQEAVQDLQGPQEALRGCPSRRRAQGGLELSKNGRELGNSSGKNRTELGSFWGRWNMVFPAVLRCGGMV